MNISIVILTLIIIAPLFRMVLEEQFRFGRIIIFALSFIILSNLSGQSSAVHLKDGSSFNGKILRKEAEGLVLQTKYGTLTIPGKDISSVDITISIKPYDDWDRYLDSLFKKLTGDELGIADEIIKEATEVTNTDVAEDTAIKVAKESVEEEISTGGDEPIKEGPRVTFTPYDEPPIPLTPIKPVYPKLAQEAEIEGTVYVQAFINPEGKVTQTKILKGISHTGLNESSIEAITVTNFQPATYEGKPVGVWITIPITYKLK